jgi:hypothetical protein
MVTSTVPLYQQARGTPVNCSWCARAQQGRACYILPVASLTPGAMVSSRSYQARKAQTFQPSSVPILRPIALPILFRSLYRPYQQAKSQT